MKEKVSQQQSKKFKCKRCGRCCMDVFLTMWAITPENRKDVMEKGRWLAYHRCDVFLTKKGGKDCLGLRIPLTCLHMDFRPSTGYFCKIYDKRPKVCSDYLCGEHTMVVQPVSKLEGK